MCAIETSGVFVFTRPTNSRMILGLFPAAATCVGFSIHWGMRGFYQIAAGAGPGGLLARLLSSMRSMNRDRNPALSGLLILLGLSAALVVLGVVAAALFRQPAPPRLAESANAARRRSPEAALEAMTPRGETRPELDALVRNDAGPSYGGGRSATPPPAAAPPAARGPSRAPGASPSAQGQMSEQERALLEGTVGRLDDKSLYGVGLKKGLLFQLGDRLIQHPRIVSWVLNNDFVVSGFMAQERVRRNCHDAAYLANYLSDAGDAGGITRGTRTFAAALRTPGSADAILGSKLAVTVTRQCEAMRQVADDKNAVARIAIANPELLMLLSDPRLVGAMGRNPDAASLVGAAQTHLGGGARR